MKVLEQHSQFEHDYRHYPTHNPECNSRPQKQLLSFVFGLTNFGSTQAPRIINGRKNKSCRK